MYVSFYKVKKKVKSDNVFAVVEEHLLLRKHSSSFKSSLHLVSREKHLGPSGASSMELFDKKSQRLITIFAKNLPRRC